ncbi:glycoside hydrolase family 3 protein [Natronohydrobacter thiooxidans]|uniref:glycoside hydrolase family 3 protein n=1 Tax=Natronohydrobacter thiooxidans TaxID=87172 RepID=UPI0008FF13E0|nr:glycoside hydrolase family 3 N-terminal domain-containing protein [Natronohydrobacter thiooxidans]
MSPTLIATAAFASTVAAPSGAQIAEQPEIVSRVHPVIEVDGLRFRDANGNGTLDPYEDWRLPMAERVADLLGRMSIEDRAGMLLINTLNVGCEDTVEGTPTADFLDAQRMTRFILRNTVAEMADDCSGRAPFGGFQVTPTQLADFTNTVQEMAEARGLGIPVLFKDNARNYLESDPRFGIGGGAEAMTAFPKELGIAAAVLGTGGLEPVHALTDVMSAEWRALGIRGMYGYMADLATEPRRYRVHETFGEDAELVGDILEALVERLQGGPVGPQTAVALTLKHFPGGGSQEGGLDPHYSFGQRQVYPSDAFEAHLAPFRRAIDAGVGAIMPYYGIPVDVTFDGQPLEEVGFSFSTQTVDWLLRDQLGFGGYVNSDTGIIQSRAWGLEHATVAERIAAAVNAGNDVLPGFSDVSLILDLLDAGLVSEDRINEAAGRLLVEQFALGLFENPGVEMSAVAQIVANDDHQTLAQQVQRQSVVLLQNEGVLPLDAGARVYAVNLDTDAVEAAGLIATTHADPDTPRPTAEGHHAAVIRVYIRNVGTNRYRSNDPEFGANPDHLNPRTGAVWGAEDGCNVAPAANPSCADDGQLGGPQSPALGLLFGGALPWEVDALSFTAMAAAESWEVFPSLDTIQAIMSEVGPERTVIANASDAPGYPEADTLFPFGHGLGY